jgi:hypothetical protein
MNAVEALFLIFSVTIALMLANLDGGSLTDACMMPNVHRRGVCPERLRVMAS